MSTDFDPRTLENIFSARTVRGVPPDVYMQPFASIADMLETQARLTPDNLPDVDTMGLYFRGGE